MFDLQNMRRGVILTIQIGHKPRPWLDPVVLAGNGAAQAGRRSSHLWNPEQPLQERDGSSRRQIISSGSGRRV
jgi:hypothetical protein